MKKIIALCVSVFMLAGCNTMEGFGKDVKKVGEKVQSAASR